MNKKYISVICSTLLISSFLMSCGGGAAVSEQPASAAQPQSALNLNDNIVSASAEVVAGKWANLAFMMGAQKVDVLVVTGVDVRSGSVLASFPDDALPQSITNAKADLLIAQKSLDDLLNTDTALAQAIIKVRNAKKTYERAFDYRDSLNYLITYKKTVIKKEETPFGVIEVPKVEEYQEYASKTTIAKADEDLALKKALFDDAQKELDRLNDLQNSPEVLSAQTRVAAIESVITQSKLFAPFDGTVIELYLNSGELVSPGAPVLLLADLSTLQVKTTDLNEVDVARVQIGDPVKVTFDALPDTTVTGKVTEIALKNAPGSGVYFNVTIALDEIPAELRWGMSAFVEIQVSK